MYNDLLISSIKEFVGQKTSLEIDGCMNISTTIDNLDFDFEEDVCSIKNDSKSFLSFNANQISNILIIGKVLKIIMDLDLTINMEKIKDV